MKKLMILIMVVALAVSVAAPPVSALDHDPSVPRPRVNVANEKVSAETDDIGVADPHQTVVVAGEYAFTKSSIIEWLKHLLSCKSVMPPSRSNEGEKGENAHHTSL